MNPLETDSFEVQVDHPVFVVGVPRSGTTLISAMLASHPNIAIAPETHFLSRWMRQYRALDVRNAEDFERFWEHFGNSEHFESLQLNAYAVRDRILSLHAHDYRHVFATVLQMYAESQDKRRWGEKTPNHCRYLRLLLEWYPHARIIYMLRDPRAVVASLARVPWATHRPIDSHAGRWRSSVNDLSQWSAEARIRVVRYEQLVLDPEFELKMLCTFLGEAYTPAMLDRSEAAEALVGGETWKESASQPLNKANIEKWRSQLSGYEVALIEHLTRREMLTMGYRPVTSRFALSQELRWYSARIVRRLRREIGDLSWWCARI